MFIVKMTTCRLNSDQKSDVHCIIVNKNKNKSKTSNYVIKQKEGKIAKVIGHTSGSDKGMVKNVKYNNKYYYVYVDSFEGPETTTFPKTPELYISNKGKNLASVVEEMNFVKRMQPTGIVPKIFIDEVFHKNNRLNVMFATEDLSRKKFKQLAHYIDSGKLDLRFSSIQVKNKPHGPLNDLIRNSKIASFMHPSFFKRNLRVWFDKNKVFFGHLFAGLKKMFKLDIYHHDLHAGNVWYNGKSIMLIDFGRSSNMKDSFKVRKDDTTNIVKEKKSFPKVKNVHKRRMLAELSKDPKNPSRSHEFFRHDVDEKIMSTFLYDSKKFARLITIFKLFLADEYANAM